MTSLVSSRNTDRLSFYRTKHCFEKYGEFETIEEFIQYCQWAHENKVRIYILGNGSNVLFKSKTVRSLILKNKLKETIKPLDNGRVEISSSAQIVEILKYCNAQSLEFSQDLGALNIKRFGAKPALIVFGSHWCASHCLV